MAYSTQGHVVTGDLMTASRENQAADNDEAIYAGEQSLASQAANDLMYASSATQWARIANGTTGQVLKATTSSAPAWGAPGMRLLRAASGSTVSTGAGTLDSIALTLGGNDALFILATFQAETQQLKTPILAHATDGGTILDLGGHCVAGAWQRAVISITQGQDAATTIIAHSDNQSTAGSVVGTINKFTATTSWTGAWTLGLNFDGMTAGGTGRWKWQVYQLSGT